MISDQSLKTYSNAALKAAIDAFGISGMNPARLRQLESELRRRNRLKRGGKNK